MTYNEKYNSTLYYIAPFYATIFPGLKRLVTVDTDIEFNVDINFLFAEFDKFDSDQLIGVANDLSPHYYQMLTGYRSNHPDTKLGTPGPLQGFNVGVLLLNLERMRQSKLYNHHLTAAGVTKLAVKYGLTGTHLGEQDWLTLVAWDSPQLVYPLNCLFNRQKGKDFLQEPWTEIFYMFHNCEGDSDGKGAFLVHGNSDSNV